MKNCAPLTDIRALDLERNAGELDMVGYTVVEPERVSSTSFVDRLQHTAIELIAARTNGLPDLLNGSIVDASGRGMAEHFWLLFEDQIFEDALMNPIGLTLASYLLGQSFVLSEQAVTLKGPAPRPLHLHCDEKAPAPLPSYPQTCCITWVLSDYSRHNGALCFVPGSHRWQRHPLDGERLDLGDAAPIEAPRGSIVVWGGNVWHGAFPRTNPGLRMSMTFHMVRYYIRPAQPFGEYVPDTSLARNPARFAKLMGRDVWMGYQAEGPDPVKLALQPRGLHD